jgi:uncharacterized membrane protein YkgB
MPLGTTGQVKRYNAPANQYYMETPGTSGGMLDMATADGRYVRKDTPTTQTMAGALVLPADGLTVGTNQIRAVGGMVGINRVPTTYALEVTGDIWTSGAVRGDGSNLTSVNAQTYKGTGAPSAAEFGYLAGVTSAIQTQINSKLTIATGFAAPTASVGLAAVAGTATTAMRSDGAPALSQSISPTWTGTHTFTASQLIAPTIGRAAGQHHTIPAVASDTFALLAAAQALTGKTYNGLAITTSTGTLTVAALKTLTVSNTITLTGTSDGFSVNVPASGTSAMGAATLTVATTNNATVANHTHAITSSSAPGAATSLLASDASGYLQLVRLGIGTAPAFQLHVGSGATSGIPLAANTIAAVQAAGGTAGAYLTVKAGTNPEVFMGSDASTYGTIGTFSNNDLGFRTNNTLKMIIQAGGNVGIGTSNPGAYLLYVNGTMNVASDLLLSGATANLYLKDTSTGFSAAATTVVNLITGAAFRSSNFTAGISGFGISAAGDAEFNNLRARGEIASAVFKINEIAATAGTQGIFFSAAALTQDQALPGALAGSFSFQAKNSDAGGMLFGIGDIVRFKAWTGAGVSDAWVTITARTNNGSTTTYTATLNSGSTSTTLRAGMAAVDYGPSGTGFITLSTDGTVGASPNLTMATHAGSPWSATTTLVRLGNLNGSYGYATAVHGLGAGQYGVSGQSWITADQTNGVRIGSNTTTRIQLNPNGSGFLASSNIAWDTAGAATIAGWTINSASITSGGITLAASATAASNKIYVGTGAFNNTNTAFYVDGTGQFSLKDKLAWDGTTLAITGSGTFTGTITASAGTVGGWTIGSAALSSGGIVLAASATAASNKIYIGTGTYNNTNTAFYVDGTGQFSLKDKLAWDGATLNITGVINATSGSFTAGAGAVVINGAGISITAASSLTAATSITWYKTGGVSIGLVGGQWSTVSGVPVTGTGLQATNDQAAGQTYATLLAYNSAGVSGGITVIKYGASHATLPSQAIITIDGTTINLTGTTAVSGVVSASGFAVGGALPSGYQFYTETNTAGVAAGFKVRSNYSSVSDSFFANFGNWGTVWSHNREPQAGTFTNAAVSPNQANAVDVIIGRTNSATGVPACIFQVANYPAGTSTPRLFIDYSGNVAIGHTAPSYLLHLATDSAAKPSTNVWTVASDGRLKRDVKAFDHGMDVISQLQPVRYRYNGLAGMPTDKEAVGFIANEVQKIYKGFAGQPMKVKLHRDDEADTELLTLNLNDLIFMVVNALKQHEGRLVALETN